MSSNVSGNVSRAPLDEVLDALRAANGERVAYSDWETTYVGRGARTIEITRNGRVIFAAVNASAEVVALDAETMEILTRIRTDSYAVGLDVAPDGSQVWVTSQGRSGQGGNSVCVFSVEGPALGRAEEAD